MVLGAVVIVTPVSGTNQWAEIDRIAFGLGVSCPMRRHASVYLLFSTAFMGLPWPKKIVRWRSAEAFMARVNGAQAVAEDNSDSSLNCPLLSPSFSAGIPSLLSS